MSDGVTPRTESVLHKVSLVLVSPKGAANVGGIARAMGNFGFYDLRIVEPRCDLKSLECKQMAMRSYDLIERATIFESLEAARADLEFCVAFCGRRPDDYRAHTPLPEFLSRVEPRLESYRNLGLVFGREEWGLRLEEIDACDWRVEIETTEDMPSLNLTSATAVVLSRLFESFGRKMPRLSLVEEKPLKHQEDLFFERLLQLMDAVEFTNPQNPNSHMSDLRAMFHRADLSDRDLRILFGILSGIERKLGIVRREPGSSSCLA